MYCYYDNLKTCNQMRCTFSNILLFNHCYTLRRKSSI